MSSQSTERIKSISKKDISGFGDPIPFGTDGLLVDMLSGLDLEEENKLGNNHYVEIEDKKENNQEVTYIKEYYLDIPKGNNTIANLDNNNHILYSVSIKITDNDINMILYKGNINESSSANNILHKKKILIDETTSITQINQEVDGE